jgi:hypothetical protein
MAKAENPKKAHNSPVEEQQRLPYGFPVSCIAVLTVVGGGLGVVA